VLTAQPTARRSTAIVTALLIAVLALPAAAFARPATDPAGATASNAAAAQPAPAPKAVAPAPVADDGTDVLPIVLGGAALIIVLCGTGYLLVQASHRRQPHIQH
jgi:streptogramin lyase